MKSILYLTDFAYQAKGRRYCDEDICITDYLRRRFDVATCHTACCEPFEDVNEGDYFADAVAWAYSKGITSGTSETAFSPYEPCLRCQIMTFLYLAFAE